MEKKDIIQFNSHVRKAEAADDVSADKFENHIVKARRNDVTARKKTFVALSESDELRDLEHDGITPSEY